MTRLALTEADRQARDRFVDWLLSATLGVGVDDGGNITGLAAAGADPPILIGSHLDSVRNGGPHDGVLGVTAGLGIIEALAGAARHRLGVVAFSNEEGARFRPAQTSSSGRRCSSKRFGRWTPACRSGEGRMPARPPPARLGPAL